MYLIMKGEVGDMVFAVGKPWSVILKPVTDFM